MRDRIFLLEPAIRLLEMMPPVVHRIKLLQATLGQISDDAVVRVSLAKKRAPKKSVIKDSRKVISACHRELWVWSQFYGVDPSELADLPEPDVRVSLRVSEAMHRRPNRSVIENSNTISNAVDSLSGLYERYEAEAAPNAEKFADELLSAGD